MHTIPTNIESDKILYPEQLYLIKGIKLLMQKLTEKKRDITDIRMPRAPYESSYTSLKKIKKLASSKNKRVVFIHLLEKGEMLKRRYRYKLRDKIEKMGIEYYPILGKYVFDWRMYHPNDGHPNDKGYAVIASMIEDILKLK